MREDFDYIKAAVTVVLFTCAVSVAVLFGYYATVEDSNVTSREIVTTKEVVTNTEVVTQPQDVNVNIDINGEGAIAGWGTLLLTACTAAAPAICTLRKRNEVSRKIDKLKL